MTRTAFFVGGSWHGRSLAASPGMTTWPNLLAMKECPAPVLRPRRDSEEVSVRHVEDYRAEDYVLAGGEDPRSLEAWAVYRLSTEPPTEEPSGHPVVAGI